MRRARNTRAKPAPLARKGEQLLVGALGTAQAQKAVRQNGAREKRLELVFDKLRHASIDQVAALAVYKR